MDYPEGILYTKEHEWVSVEDLVATIGITEYAQEQLGDIVFVELPVVGDELSTGDAFGVVESVKAVSDIFAPVSGEVVEINEELESNSGYLNSSPYEEGWILKIKLSSPEELEELLSSDDYIKFVSEEGK